MLVPFSALVRKDLRLFFLDRRAVLMSVVAPIFIASFFGYIFGGGAGNQDDSRIPVVAVDQDSTPFSRSIVDHLKQDAYLEVKAAAPDRARDLVREGRTTAAIIIPKSFGVDMSRAFFTGGSKPEVQVLGDPSHAIEMRMVQGMVQSAVMQSIGSLMGGSARAQSLLSLPFQVSSEGVTAHRGRLYNGYAHSFGGMGIQFLLMVGVEVGVSLLLARQQGVWKRLSAAPVSKATLLGSRTFSSALTSMGTLVVLFAFARIVFGVRIQGSFAGFVGICAAFSLMTAAFGLFIATVGKTAEATRAIAILVTLLMVMLGGGWVPTFIFPRWLQSLTVAIPTRWAMDGLDAVTWRGLDFSHVAAPIGLLMLTAVFFAAIAVKRWE
ncbi:MAG TPA: ABC transporter permease [Candidatus Limnocylindrales bacterium]|nr:ABC transporter permease [Candidatus Limnocylindrales bacterium]